MRRTPRTDPTAMSKGSRTQNGRRRRRKPSIRRSHQDKTTFAMGEATVPVPCGACNLLTKSCSRQHPPVVDVREYPLQPGQQVALDFGAVGLVEQLVPRFGV